MKRRNPFVKLSQFQNGLRLLFLQAASQAAATYWRLLQGSNTIASFGHIAP